MFRRRIKSVLFGKRPACAGCLAGILCACLLPGGVRADGDRPKPLELYVAVEGNDAWSGRLPDANAGRTDGPLATLSAARDAIRMAKKTSRLPWAGAVVRVRQGVHSLSDTLKFGDQDSGTAEGPIVYRAFQGEHPLLTGAKPIRDFRPYRGQIVQADVAAQGLKGITFRQLIFNGRRQPLARYPNFAPQNPYGGGWAYVDGKVVNINEGSPGESPQRFTYRAEDARHWSQPEEGEVFVFPRYNWWNNIVRIESVDPAKRQILLAGKASFGIRPGDRYFVQNLFEELDAPGEWYLDRKTWTLYFWPPAPLSGQPVYAPCLKTIVEIASGASFLTLQGFTIEGCSGHAVVLNRCDHCLVAGNTIRNVGEYDGAGVVTLRGSNNGVVGNDISEVGSHGIVFSGGGDAPTLTAAANYADNNYIHHTGVYCKEGVGILLTGVGHKITHNLIHDGPRMGIRFGGNNHLIEYNHIRHVNLETEDTGAVYTWGHDWLNARGTVVRYNYLHDILGYGRRDGRWVSPYLAWGVYLDDNAGGVDVIGNIIVRAHRAGIFLHNARDSRVENNIFVDGEQAQAEFGGWTPEGRFWPKQLPQMIKGYNSVEGQPAWKNMRNMSVRPENAVLPDGTIMSGNVVERNIFSYREPNAKMFGFRDISWDHNRSDHNLFWHHRLPPETGLLKAGKSTGPNLIANPGFEEEGSGGVPPQWQWKAKSVPWAKVVIDAVRPHGAQRSLRIDAAAHVDGFIPVHGELASNAVPALPGHTYRLSAYFRAEKPGLRSMLAVQSAGAGYAWIKPLNFGVGTDWQEIELAFRLPAAGDADYHPQMKTFWVRINTPASPGSLWVDDVRLEEAELLDPWQSWQSQGTDQHSLLSDPLFVDAEKDDYRLRAESPAWKLGFQPIPVDKIGPYADPLRASWPIVEAEGAREKPLAAAGGR